MFFKIIFVCVAVILHIFIYFALFRYAGVYAPLRQVFKVLIALNAIFLIANFVGSNIRLSSWLNTLFASSIGIMWIFLVVSIVCIIIMLIVRVAFGYYYYYSLSPYIATILIVIAILATIVSFYEGYRLPVVSAQTIKLHGLKQDLKVAVIADLHITKLVKPAEVEKIVSEVNQLKPDLVFLVGDIIDAYYVNAKDSASKLKGLNAPLGIYYVLGNHEYHYDINNIVRAFSDMDFKVLMNSEVTLDDARLNIAGISDMSSARYKVDPKSDLAPNLDKALEFANPSYPTILLAHQPKAIRLVGDKKVDLVVSGHTHGGQIFPFNFLVPLQQPYVRGLHEYAKGKFVYISVGTGQWGAPMRLFATREITLLNLKAEN
ncbi:hypothetical protein BKH43_02930 [Helicobacter sp. 13S00401-1]|uniref:metallophosphoesterase n=1 Tax=Helicobacter sp. 13S00401-1 TaxID=1905758 RepID=UPI000BA64A47|nr:metallophosphoesterase [Helicobacter sp. 13S00401-1]PAF51177.1 hypothetical protein BKH43_02930 [Helicobacter sp. 13S00401-1]